MRVPQKITTPEALSVFLQDAPVQWAQDLTTRIALRVFPFVLRELAQPHSAEDFRYVAGAARSAFRAGLIAWAACTYRDRDFSAFASATTASYTNAIESPSFPASLAASAGVAIAALAAADAAASAAAHAAFPETARASVAGAAIARAGQALAAPFPGSDALWDAVRADCQWLAGEERPLIGQPLWLVNVRGDDRFLSNMPPGARAAFDAFADSTLARTTPWGMLADWYRAILPSSVNAHPHRFFGGRLDTELASKPGEFWDRDPNRVIADIAKLIKWIPPGMADGTGGGAEPAAKHVDIPPQAPAPIEVAVVDEGIVRVVSGSSNKGADIVAIHKHLLSEARGLSERLAGQMPDARMGLDVLIGELGNSLDEMQVYGVGYWTNVLGQIVARVDERMLEDAAGRFAGLIANLNIFLAHQSEWIAYSKVARQAELAALADAETGETGGAVVEKIRDAQGLVAENISGPLEMLNRALCDAPMYNPETAYGFYQSLANVLQAVAEVAMRDGPAGMTAFASEVGSEIRKKSASAIAVGVLASSGYTLLQLAKMAPSMFSFLEPVLKFLKLAG